MNTLIDRPTHPSIHPSTHPSPSHAPLQHIIQVQLPPEEAVVLITTYSMLAYTGKRNDEVSPFPS